MEWNLLLILACIVWYLFLRTTNLYIPENVLVEDGDFLLIEDLPKSKFSKSKCRKIKKSFVHKIQLAGNIVTLFNASSNAVDIMLPNSKLAQPIYDRAKYLFPDAAVEVINC
jgi:hypothetical protein